MALVSALLLTMISIPADGNIGEALVEEGLAGTLYSALAFLASCLLLLATFASAVILIMCSFVQTDEGFLVLVSQWGYFFRVCVFCFFSGLVFWILLVMFQFATLMSLSVCLPILALCMCPFGIIIFGMVHGTKVMYDINATDAKMMV